MLLGSAALSSATFAFFAGLVLDQLSQPIGLLVIGFALATAVCVWPLFVRVHWLVRGALVSALLLTFAIGLSESDCGTGSTGAADRCLSHWPGR